jgi:putative acetyltransferase
MGSVYRVRPFAVRDAVRVAEIYVRSVREIASARYEPAQIEAWVGGIEPALEAGKWLPYLIAFYTYVAIDERDVVDAWIGMRSDGYVDMLFALPVAVGTGAAGALYATVERIAFEIGVERMTTHASRFAEPFFAKRGWRVDARSASVKDGVAIPRAEMSKALARPPCPECLSPATA